MIFKVTARCIMIRDGEILVQVSKHGDFYRLPGGRIRPEETILQGLRRELYEELGIEDPGDPTLSFIVESFYRRRNGLVHEIGFYFTCEPPSGPVQPKEEHLKIAWVPIEEITAKTLRPSILASYIKKLGDGKPPARPLYLVNVDIEPEH